MNPYFRSEEYFLAKPEYTQHYIEENRGRFVFPLERMEQYDYFWLDKEDTQKVRSAIQRYYQKEPVSFFTVRKVDEDSWICRRML